MNERSRFNKIYHTLMLITDNELEKKDIIEKIKSEFDNKKSNPFTKPVKNDSGTEYVICSEKTIKDVISLCKDYGLLQEINRKVDKSTKTFYSIPPIKREAINKGPEYFARILYEGISHFFNNKETDLLKKILENVTNFKEDQILSSYFDTIYKDFCSQKGISKTKFNISFSLLSECTEVNNVLKKGFDFRILNIKFLLNQNLYHKINQIKKEKAENNKDTNKNANDWGKLKCQKLITLLVILKKQINLEI